MELKTARLTLLIDPAKKAAFERLCARQDQTPSQVVRRLIRDYLTQHGVAYVPSGTAAPPRAKRPSPPSAAARGAAGRCDEDTLARLISVDERLVRARRLAAPRLGADRRRGVAPGRRGGRAGVAPPGLGGQGAVSRRRRVRTGAVRRRAQRAVRDARGRRAAARPAGAALPPPTRRPRRLLPDGDRRGIGRRVGVRRRLLPQGRRHAARTALPGVPPLSRQHGDGRAGRRRLRLHGDVGNDGAVVVLPRHRQSPPRRDPAGRLPVPAGRAHRRDRHPAVLRRAPGEHRRLHLRQHACPAPDAVLGLGGVPARPVRLRREGGARCRCTSGCPRRTRPRRRRSRP